MSSETTTTETVVRQAPQQEQQQAAPTTTTTAVVEETAPAAVEQTQPAVVSTQQEEQQQKPAVVENIVSEPATTATTEVEGEKQQDQTEEKNGEQQQEGTSAETEENGAANKKGFNPPPPRAKHINPEDLLRQKQEEEAKRKNKIVLSDDDLSGENEIPAAAATISEPQISEEEKLRQQQEELDKKHREERTALESAESTARPSIEQEAEQEFQTSIVDAEKAARSEMCRLLREKIAKVEASAEVRRREAGQLVTALTEIRRHFATEQERVNLTKQYADIALKCRHFDEWMNERYMSSPQLARNDRTGLISLEDVERMHSERDQLLDELERLADNMANLRHLIMDVSELKDKQPHGDGSQEGGSKNNSPSKSEQQQQGAVAVVETQSNVTATTSQQHVHVYRRPASTIYERTSATDRAEEAMSNDRVLTAKLKELEEEKRQLDIEINHREKKSAVNVEQANRRFRAAAAGMSGMNKELLRLEEAVKAHFRVLRTAYQSMKTEFPVLFEYDAFKEDGPKPKPQQQPALITDKKSTEEQQQPAAIEAHTSSRRSSAANSKVALISNTAANVVKPAASPAANPPPPVNNAAATFAREASRLTSPQLLSRVHKAAELEKKEKADRQKSIVDRAREEASEEARSQRRIQREAEKSACLSPKEQIRQKQVSESSKMMSTKTFKRV